MPIEENSNLTFQIKKEYIRFKNFENHGHRGWRVSKDFKKEDNMIRVLFF